MNLGIKGKNGEVIIEIEKIISNGEIDRYRGIDIWTIIKIRSGNFTGRGSAIFSSLDIELFYDELIKCYEGLHGAAKLVANSDCFFELNLIFDKYGKVICSGHYDESWESNNQLKFIYESDQTFFKETLIELKAIIESYTTSHLVD